MRSPTISLVLIFTLLCTACSPTLRIKPGELPTAEPPPPQLKTEAEGYLRSFVDESEYKEITSGPQFARTKRIVEKLSRAAGFPPNTFPVHLVDAGDEVNAAAFNGASILVYRELLVRVPDDNELAAVLGHEIGHIMAKHYQDAEEEKSRADAVNVGSSILGAVASIATSVAGFGGAADLAGNLTQSTTGMVGYGAFVGSFNRTQEYEADHIGLLMMARAGYNPEAAVSVWNRSEEIFGSSDSSVGAFFSTHPASSDRMEALTEALPYAEKEYQRYKKR